MSGEDDRPAEDTGDQSRTHSGERGDRQQSEGQGEPRQAGQGQPRRQRRGQQRQPGGGGSVTDAIDTDQVLYVSGIVGILGAWIGLAPLLVGLLANQSVALAVASVFTGIGISVPVLAGPLIVLYTAFRVADRMDASDKEILATVGVASGVGHLVMMVVSAVLVFFALSASTPGGGRGGGDVLGAGGIGDLLVPVIMIAVATGVIGLATVYFRQWDRDRRRGPPEPTTGETPR